MIAETDTELAPETPSYRFRLKLPFIEIYVEEMDGLVEMAHLQHYANYKAHEAMEVNGLVRWFMGLVNGLVDGRSEKRARTTGKCDGNHAEPPCPDPKCWCRS